MTDKTYSWLTIHRARLPREVWAGDTSFAGPVGAGAWRYGPHAPRGENGLRSGRSAIWGGIGFHDSRAQAEAALEVPESQLPFAGAAEESWHALAAVIAHRGEVDWSTRDEPHPALRPVDDDPGGVIAVITSAGFDWMDESRMPGLLDFLAKVDEVVEVYRTLEGNLRAQLFNANGTPEGMTFSLWRDDSAMLAAAYRDGKHRSYLDSHRAQPMFDRSSFTRMRVLASRGAWDGEDPAAA